MTNRSTSRSSTTGTTGTTGATGTPGTDDTLSPTERTASDMAQPPLTATTIETEREQPLAEAGRETAQTAGRLAERAADTGLRQADRGREKTAEGLHKLAAEMRTISTDMESQQPAIANVAEAAADQTERIATYLRDTDVRQIINNVEEVARRQPLLFVGGAFVLGLAAARFLKAAGGGRETIRSYRVDPYGYRTTDVRTGLPPYSAEPVEQSPRL
jgi:hypothetical protein